MIDKPQPHLLPIYKYYELMWYVDRHPERVSAVDGFLSEWAGDRELCAGHLAELDLRPAAPSFTHPAGRDWLREHFGDKIWLWWRI